MRFVLWGDRWTASWPDSPSFPHVTCRAAALGLLGAGDGGRPRGHSSHSWVWRAHRALPSIPQVPSGPPLAPLGLSFPALHVCLTWSQHIPAGTPLTRSPLQPRDPSLSAPPSSPAGLAPQSLPLPLDWIPFPSPIYFETIHPPASTLLLKCNLMLRRPSVYSSSSIVNGYLRSTCKNPTPRKLSSWTRWERRDTRKFKKSRISFSRGLPSLILTRKPGK